MTKRILSVGQCGPDNAALRRLLDRHFQVEIDLADALEDAVKLAAESRYDLVLVNRKLDADYSDGIEVIRALKRQVESAETPVMLITNYPEHQAAAVAAGAEMGFGKLEYSRPETIDRLRRFLAPQAASEA